MNSLNHQNSLENSENILAKTMVNSRDELISWLKKEHISPASIARFSVSFMAKIPENTKAELSEENGKMMIRVGESSLKIAENLETGYARTHFIAETFREKLLATIDRELLPSGHKEALPSGHHTELPAPKTEKIAA